MPGLVRNGGEDQGREGEEGRKGLEGRIIRFVLSMGSGRQIECCSVLPAVYESTVPGNFSLHKHEARPVPPLF